MIQAKNKDTFGLLIVLASGFCLEIQASWSRNMKSGMWQNIASALWAKKTTATTLTGLGICAAYNQVHKSAESSVIPSSTKDADDNDPMKASSLPFGLVPPPVPGMVRIYHYIGDRVKDGGDLLESVRKHGLLTADDLHKQGLIKKKLPDSYVLPDHYRFVYFAYENLPPEDRNCVALDVDPQSTYVYNREFRADANAECYHGSKIRLSEYIKMKEKAFVMGKNRPKETCVIFDPFTAEPSVVSWKDQRMNDDNIFQSTFPYLAMLSVRHYAYYNEITIPHSIPAKDLIFSTPLPLHSLHSQLQSKDVSDRNASAGDPHAVF